MPMLELEHGSATRSKPANRWRNYYFAYRYIRPVPGHQYWLKGRLNVGQTIFPSKEIAEQYALEFIRACKPEARSWFDYLGAYPEDDPPG